MYCLVEATTNFFLRTNPGRVTVQAELLAMCLDGTHVHNLLIILSNILCSGLDLEMTWGFRNHRPTRVASQIFWSCSLWTSNCQACVAERRELNATTPIAAWGYWDSHAGNSYCYFSEHRSYAWQQSSWKRTVPGGRSCTTELAELTNLKAWDM